MNLLTLVFIAIALALDAFTVSLICGIKIHHLSLRKFFKISCFFAGFQAFMPLIGVLIGDLLHDKISTYSSIIAFLIFIALGIKTLIDYFSKSKSENCNYCQCANLTCLVSLATATSIDALLVGVIFAFHEIHLLQALFIIGFVTFIISFIGCLMGNRLGRSLGKKATLVAGIILLGLAIKVALGEGSFI